MELLLSSATLSVLASVCLSFVGLVCWHFRHLLRKQLPPGSLGLPLLGETLQFALLSTTPIGTPLPYFSCRMRRYGMVFKSHLLGRPTLVSMNPDLSKFLLNNEGKLVQAYYPRIFAKILGPALTLQGASHRAFRELANLNVSNSAVQKLHLDAVQEHFLTGLQSWQQYGPTEVFDVLPDCKKWVFSYSVKSAVGLEADDPITASLKRDFFILSSGYAVAPINLPGFKFNKVLKARERIIETFTKLARSRKHEGQKEAKDILDMLLKASDGEEHYMGLHVAEWIFAFVIAAFENNFLLIANVLKFLAENRHVVNELERENMAIRKSKALKEKLTWDDYMHNMPLTRSVVRETLRLANITPYVMKESIEEISFRDIIIPRGWMVVLNFSTVHLSPDYYPNPLRFDPWRWMDSESNKPITNSLDYLLPFGGGVRRCPGAPIAAFEASIFVHYLVTLYKWKRIHKKGVQQDVVSCVTFPLMKKGLFLSVQPLDYNEI